MASVTPPNLLQRGKAALQALFGVQPPANDVEIGWGGVRVTGGIVSDEHNAELKGRLGIQKAAIMRRSDAQVRCVEKVISLPLRSTEWLIEEPDGAGAAEKEAAETLRANLFGGMETSWDDLLREACLAIYYGFRVPEIVWEDQKGVLGIRKVASRNPELLENWCYDEFGRLVGYVYAGNRPKGAGLEAYSVGSDMYERIPIPLEKTLHFIYDGENENPQGFGLWRSMYPHWYIKQAMYKVIAIGVERNLLDVPVGRLESGAQAASKAQMLQMLQRWRAAEDAAVVLTGDQSLEFVGSHRSLMDAMPFLHHHDAKIAQTGLAQFLNLGQSGSGTQALASEHTKIFELAEEANARWIEQTVGAQLIKRWVQFNYGDGLKAPLLKHTPISSRDQAAWANALSTLAGGSFVHPTPDDEAFIRDLFELPEIPVEQLRVMADERKAEQEKQFHQQQRERITVPPGKEPVKASDPGDGHTFAERDDADRRARENQENSFAERAAELLTDIQEGYLKALRPLIDDAQDATKIAQGKPIDKLPDVAVPGARRYTEFVRGFLRDALEAGRLQLSEETGQKPGPVSNRLRQWLNAKAEVLAADHLGQLKTAVLGRVLSGLRAEMTTEQIFSDAGAAAVEEFNANVESGWGLAAAELLQQLSAE